MSEEYNGWSNHDTWNVNLWLSNDEFTWKELRRICSRNYSADRAEKELVSLAREVIPVSEGISYDSVDWEEIYNATNED
jgi:hypothetical protein